MDPIIFILIIIGGGGGACCLLLRSEAREGDAPDRSVPFECAHEPAKVVKLAPQTSESTRSGRIELESRPCFPSSHRAALGRLGAMATGGPVPPTTARFGVGPSLPLPAAKSAHYELDRLIFMSFIWFQGFFLCRFWRVSEYRALESGWEGCDCALQVEWKRSSV
jgi:hypothetical protein